MAEHESKTVYFLIKYYANDSLKKYWILEKDFMNIKKDTVVEFNTENRLFALRTKVKKYIN